MQFDRKVDELYTIEIIRSSPVIAKLFSLFSKAKTNTGIFAYYFGKHPVSGALVFGLDESIGRDRKGARQGGGTFCSAILVIGCARYKTTWYTLTILIFYKKL